MNINFICMTMMVVLITSCSTRQQNKTAIKKEMSGEVSAAEVSTCELTQRDLSVRWEDRNYWCTIDSRADRLSQRNKINAMNRKIIEESRLKLKKTNIELKKVIIDMEGKKKQLDRNSIVHISPYSDSGSRKHYAKPVIGKEPKKNNALSSSSNEKSINDVGTVKKEKYPARDVDVHNIWFAENITVLGSNGKQHLSSLMPSIKSSSHIFLRGYIKEGELEKSGLMSSEMMSVARSLSIRKKLITEGNIDKRKITILHHKPGSTGRYVEVLFNG